MADSVLPSGELIGWFACGKLTVEKYYIKCVSILQRGTYTDVFIHQLPGHKGTVTAVDFHPKEPISAYMPFPELIFAHVMCKIVLTGSKDGTMILGELEPGVAV